MDNHFKFWYETYAVSILTKMEKDWKKVVNNIDDLWECVGDLIDRQDFKNSFYNESEHLLFISYDFEEAFEKANTEWRIELMQRFVNQTIECYDDDVPLNSNVATWNERTNSFDINTNIAKSLRRSSRKRKLEDIIGQ